MITKNSKVLVYLDHNVLDKMTKGYLDNVKRFINKEDINTVFSDENLNEISRSKGYEDKFLALLKEIGAKYICPVFTDDFQYTGHAKIQDINPIEAYSSYIKNKAETPQYGYGLSEMLRKFYGGIEDKSFSEIINSGMGELLQLIESSLIDFKKLDDISEEQKLTIDQVFSQVKKYLPNSSSEIGNVFDLENGTSHVRQVEETFSVGPKVLNNIKGTNVLKQIWGKLSENFPDNIIDIETFFGLTPYTYGTLKKKELTLIEKVNAIYHQLNFIGYHRDSDMKKQKRFNASFSDMTHAGIAIFCNLFICMDKDLVMKASAAYEYLGIGTKILYLNNNS